MKKTLFFIFFMVLSLYSAPNNDSKDLNSKDNKYFKNTNDYYIEGGSCSWECRETTEHYGTRITGFDIAKGITFCKVYDKTNYNELLSISATKTNQACVKETDLSNVSQYTKILQKSNDLSYASQIKYDPSDTKITFSKFLSSLATLNPNIIDRETTNNQGQLVLKNGIEQFSVATISNVSGVVLSTNTDLSQKTQAVKDGFGKIINGHTLDNVTAIQTSASDGFNKNNMGYFSDLFMANEKIYLYLQGLIFVLVGGFFITRLGTEKIQTYLENRGESDGKRPYLHKFYIPLIMLGLFFMPIPEANDKAHSTIIQNVIRYFADMSTDVADMTSATMNKTYMDKIYKSLGYISPKGISDLAIQQEQSKHIVKQLNDLYAKTCAKRFNMSYGSYTFNYINSLDEEGKKALLQKEKNDINKIVGTKYDITLDACIAMELQAINAKKSINSSEQMLKSIEKTYDNNQIKSKVTELDKYFSSREQQLGWINSLITPSSAILSEVFVFADDRAVTQDMKKATKASQKNTAEKIAEGNIDNDEDELNNSILGTISGELVYMMLPGATDIKNFLKDTGKKTTQILTSLVEDIPFIGSITKGITNIATTTAAYALTIFMAKKTLFYIPLLVCTTASIVAFIAYLVTLIKYFYISPFVVAFALTTNKMSKIVEFLVTGISIFLKPVLIVLFIGLALFVHTLIDEIFVFISIEQFTGIKTNADDYQISFIIGAIKGLLLIFGKLASSYIIWKLIVSGPAWALSLVGVDGKQDDMISQGIEANLAKRAFVV